MSAIVDGAQHRMVLYMANSAVAAGLVGTTSLVVGLICRLPAGFLVDRFDRRMLMIICDVVRLVVYTLLGLAVVRGMAGLELMLVVVIIGAAANAVFSTAEHAAVRNLVPAEQLSAAVARNEARSYGVSLAGPPLGGLLLGLGRSLPFLGNAVSYLFSLAAVLLIRRPLQEERERSSIGGGGAAAAEGVTFVFANPFLRSLLLIAAPLNCAFTGMIFSIIIALQRNGTPPVVVGTAETIIGLGGLVGAVAAPAIQRRVRVPTLVMTICWATAGLMALSTLLTSSVAAAVPVGLAILLAPTANAALFGYQAAITPDRLQGRVVSVIFLAATSAAALAPILAGLLSSYLHVSVAMLVFPLMVAGSAIAATFSSGIRSIGDTAERTEALEG